MQENVPILESIMGIVDTLVKALDGNSSNYDLDGMDSEIYNMRT